MNRIEMFFLACMATKERILQRFFSLPGIIQLFRYITPNDLCYARMAAAIFIMYLYFITQYEWAFALFVLAVITDFIDGPLARWKNEITEDGKKLDPIADKMLISIPLLLIGTKFFDSQTITFYVVVEALLIFTAIFLKPYLVEKFSIPLASGSNSLGQMKMTLQSISMGLLMFDPRSESVTTASEYVLWGAIAFGIGSFIRHLARMDGAVEQRKKIVTIPNLITLLGVFLCIPATFALLHGRYLVAFSLLVFIFFTDALDGVIARRFNMRTAFGAVIDPLRDYLVRFLVLVWIVILLDSPIFLAMSLCIVIVECVIAGINIATARRLKTVQLVTRWGKNRGIVHFSVFAILLLHAFEYAVFSRGILELFFALMLLSSIIALLSYYGQRQRLLARENQTAGQR